MKKLSFSIAAMFWVAIFFAQNGLNEASLDVEKTSRPPLDGVVERRAFEDRRILSPQPLREADVVWERRVWRVIDVREKQNFPFAEPGRSFFELLKNEISAGAIAAYSTDDDRFSRRLSSEQAENLFVERDSIIVYDEETFEAQQKVIVNELDPESVKRFRIKEVWFFDKNTSSVGCRILGIAPLLSVFDSNTGEFRYEKPLFWAYWPDCREAMARHKAFQTGNDAAAMSWDDVFEMRRFSSAVVKASNVRDERLEDVFTGRDRLLAGEKISASIFDYEQDLWSY